jgi:hypothetical protein
MVVRCCTGRACCFNLRKRVVVCRSRRVVSCNYEACFEACRRPRSRFPFSNAFGRAGDNMLSRKPIAIQMVRELGFEQ